MSHRCDNNKNEWSWPSALLLMEDFVKWNHFTCPLKHDKQGLPTPWCHGKNQLGFASLPARP